MQHESASDTGFEALVDAHGAGVHRVCRAILRDEHLGADAAQEAFLRLWKRFTDRRRGMPIEPVAYLRKAAVSSALDLARRRGRLALTSTAEGTPAEPAAAQTGEPPSAAVNAELEQRFEAALRALPEGQRTVFLLRHDSGLPLAEVADVLGVGPATVKTQFARACLRLQRHLRPFDPHGDPRAGASHAGQTTEPER